MKKLFIILALILGNQCVNAQTKVKLDQSGNTYIPSKPSKQPDQPIGKEFIDKDGIKYPVYQNSKGRLYITRTSKKTGKSYKQYLEVEPIASN